MKKTSLKMLEKAMACALAVCIVFGALAFYTRCGNIEDEVLRLHVLANSDSDEDQALKLCVRDRVLSKSAELLAGTENKDAAKVVLKENISALESEAADEIRLAGYDYPVRAELVNTYFPTRVYGDVTLPAGKYDALRINIGEAAGHNWWCVIFPALCLPAVGDGRELNDVLGESELEIVGGGVKYKAAFKALEIFEELKRLFE